MKKLTRILLVLAACALAVSLLAGSVNAAEVAKARTYSGQFTDVSESAWYYKNVADAYERGLINGRSDTAFEPDGTLTIAETIKLAAVCHQLLTKGAVDPETFAVPEGAAWYEPYVTYAAQRWIVTETYEDFGESASRGVVAVLFSRALISADTAMTEINTAEFGALKDVPTEKWYASSIYRMYRWGILVGDDQGNINPENNVKRSEIAAIVTRVIDPAARVQANGKAVGQTAQTQPAQPAPETTETPAAVTPAVVTNGVLKLYEGDLGQNEPASPVGGFAADFALADGTVSVKAAYNVEYVNEIAAEKDNISFRILSDKDAALDVLSSKLKAAAVGANGTKLREPSAVYTLINDLFELWIDGERRTVGGLWYAEHDGYTAYAFYLEETLDLEKVTSYRLVCGDVTADVLKQSGLGDVADLSEGAATVVAGDTVESGTAVDNTLYRAAIDAAKSTALSVPFEYESDRCYILYGEGLYGTGAGDYRLLFVFRDGTSQTIVNQRLNAIRVNNAGNVLYYTVDAPDGGAIQYGVNFDN
ncbi:MAG: S-layer homology domain-containing protein [Clostridiales bacterium]|nr:S-layer homology domain-containing protein [Clostridiales bacterium]